MNNKYYRNLHAGRIAVLGAVVWMMMGSAFAYAQDADAPHASDVERAAREWLAMQRDNRAATPTQPVLGDVASLVYQRYLDSFKNKIPDTMNSQLGSAGGMSGGGQAAQ
ncbi:DUF3613 domain-containing protein [Burkholderia cenocepacia]|uniref:DUF3613 domain-containing protein n=1 Tax=Burkholderia cenocepacia TaxID=95486 RepID=UPI00196B4360|nr:DUF3613 domain-containing protein [Burkholderia cenocepacia]MBN3505310.1 DUF3613 domain-containing protein [Burkholderia cenocepacia]MCO1396737.1 DUF3613 domain-containing protein [Burkholderia cenocepacia]MCO1409311.1 DUF3613 domain-containing protein [Burkholderia cenocepacia]MCO8321871.1 DUF3613 domain-containing protein [Burkholderia cenocepacia]MCO8329155.1 DUF3613 domain-containing protein [Burkholderia cenocepacia]